MRKLFRCLNIEPSEKSTLNVILRSARLNDEVGQGATKNLGFLQKNKDKILRFAQNDGDNQFFS